MILAGASNSLERLDTLYRAPRFVRYLPINTAAMRRSAELWAQARREHRPTAGKGAIDADVILAAQAMEFCSDADDWAIVTENVDHLARYVGNRARSRRAVVEERFKPPGEDI